MSRKFHFRVLVLPQIVANSLKQHFYFYFSKDFQDNKRKFNKYILKQQIKQEDRKLFFVYSSHAACILKVRRSLLV